MTEEEKRIKKEEKKEKIIDGLTDVGIDVLRTALLTAVTIGVGILFNKKGD